jgi:hypothetical protein
MSKLPNDCICLFYFQDSWGGEGWFEGDSTWLIHYKKKSPKNTDSHPAVLLNSFKFCAPVVFVWFWLFFSCLRRRGWRYKRESDSTIFTNPWNSIEKGCHTNCVTFLAFFTTNFDEHFFWKEIFQWYFVGTGI